LTFASVYEILDPLTTVRKQRFWDFFDGDFLRSWWQENGTGSSGMVDAVDEGFRLTSGTATSNNRFINFNTIRPYSETGSVGIWITKKVTSTNSIEQAGFLDTTSFLHFALIANDSLTEVNYTILTKDGTTQTNTEGTVAHDSIFHGKKIENTSTSNIMFMDGVLDVTKTTNRPAARLQPMFRTFTRTTAAREARIRYFEVFNT